ncbi:hypothetical protein VPG91_01510 [Nitrospirillum amazonense]|uniref:hypothetical protein n=1 Tax=Nitrospirillum amazonense TaxID=28077 RepID=UPI002DD424C7|nr:hypothetical protein [Nitrospirillum amazonense]MEC4589650.1 hypothetical protein [Nitrospirillum amazonense]
MLVCAVLMRGLIPVGYMPNPHGLASGESPFILCGSVHDALTDVQTDAQPPAPHVHAATSSDTHHSLIHRDHLHHDPGRHPLPAVMDMHQHDAGGHHGAGGHPIDAPCVFAAVVSLAVGLAIVILVLRPATRQDGWILAMAQTYPASRLPGAQPARGPPPIFS